MLTDSPVAPTSCVLEPALARAIVAAGNQAKLARALGITRAAVAQWRRVPAERVIDVERVSGVSRNDLRPDLYPPTAGTPA